MAGELKRAQFVDNEVKTAVRQTIPALIERIEQLEEKVANLSKPKADPKKKG